MAGRDTLVVMPTGSGKSAVYQVPGAAARRPDRRRQPAHRPAARPGRRRCSSTATAPAAPCRPTAARASRAREAAFEALRAGDVEFLFLAPEQLSKPEVLDAVAEARPSLFVVDEAHCISSWGHDFRPDYLRLHTAIERLGRPTVLALTATASPPVREEIVEPAAAARPGAGRARLRPAEPLASRCRRSATTTSGARPSCCGRWARPSPGSSTPPPARARSATPRRSAELGIDAAAYHAGHAGRPTARTCTTRFTGRRSRRRRRDDRLRHGHRQGRRALRAARRGGRLARQLLPGDRPRRPRRRAGRGGAVLPPGGPRAAPVLRLRRRRRARRCARSSRWSTTPTSAVEPTALAEEMDVPPTRLAGLVNLLEQAGAVEVRDRRRHRRRRRRPRPAAGGATPPPRSPRRTARSSSRGSR